MRQREHMYVASWYGYLTGEDTEKSIKGKVVNTNTNSNSVGRNVSTASPRQTTTGTSDLPKEGIGTLSLPILCLQSNLRSISIRFDESYTSTTDTGFENRRMATITTMAMRIETIRIAIRIRVRILDRLVGTRYG